MRRRGKVEADTSRHEVIGYTVVNLQYYPSQAVVNAECHVFAEKPARATGEFPLDPNNADSGPFPLRDGREVEQVTQVLSPQTPPLLTP